MYPILRCLSNRIRRFTARERAARSPAPDADLGRAGFRQPPAPAGNRAGRRWDAGPFRAIIGAITRGRGRVAGAGVAAGLAGIAALGLGRCGSFPGGADPIRPLNVVVVTLDTLSARHLTPYGQTRIETPAFERVAAEGVLFEQAAATVPLTLPSHSSMFTGTYPMFHGVRDNGGYYLPDDSETLAEALAAAGYRTGAFTAAFVVDSRPPTTTKWRSPIPSSAGCSTGGRDRADSGHPARADRRPRREPGARTHREGAHGFFTYTPPGGPFLLRAPYRRIGDGRRLLLAVRARPPARAASGPRVALLGDTLALATAVGVALREPMAETSLGPPTTCDVFKDRVGQVRERPLAESQPLHGRRLVLRCVLLHRVVFLLRESGWRSGSDSSKPPA